MKDLGILIAYGNDMVFKTPGNGELFLQDRQKGIYNYRFTDSRSSTEIRIYKQQAMEKYLALQLHNFTVDGDPF
jgi:hypothetical protein